MPLRDQAHDLAAMAAAITDRTRLIFVCNPNNPTGTVVHHDELVEFLDRVPEDCLVVLDEAYTQYVRDPEVPDGMTIYRDRPNVAVLRTFSKAYGLAGLRVGFLVGHEPVAAAVRKTMLTFSVNALAQAAAVASLAAEAELLDRVDAVVKERDRVRDELLGQGWTVPPTEANFVWLPLGDRHAGLRRGLRPAGVGVRPFRARRRQGLHRRPRRQRRVPGRGEGLSGLPTGPVGPSDAPSRRAGTATAITCASRHRPEGGQR